MDREEQIYSNQLNVLFRKAKEHKNVLEMDEIKEEFQDVLLTPAQLDRIISILESRKIDVLTVSGECDEEEADPGEEVEEALSLMDSENISTEDPVRM